MKRGRPGYPVRRSDGTVFKNLSAAARAHDVAYNSIRYAIQHGTKCGGYHWEYDGSTSYPAFINMGALRLRLDEDAVTDMKQLMRSMLGRCQERLMECNDSEFAPLVKQMRTLRKFDEQLKRLSEKDE